MRRRVIQSLAALAAHAPSLAYRLADLAASVGQPSVDPGHVRSVFEYLSLADARRVASHARASLLRNDVVAATMVSAGMSPIRTLVIPNERLTALSSPAILGAFHLGALTAFGAALERVPGRVLVVRRNGPEAMVPCDLTIELTDGDEQHRALVFHRALDWLRGGNSVFMTLDPELAVRIEAPFRGRSLLLARGPFAIARILGVPIVPLLARWRAARVEIVVGDPIHASGDEHAMATQAAAWLEQYLLGSPLEISERILTLTR